MLSEQALALAAIEGNQPLGVSMNAPNVLKLAIGDNRENLALIAASLESESSQMLTENEPGVGFENIPAAEICG